VPKVGYCTEPSDSIVANSSLKTVRAAQEFTATAAAAHALGVTIPSQLLLPLAAGSSKNRARAPVLSDGDVIEDFGIRHGEFVPVCHASMMGRQGIAQ
jgi:hypothetical protein